MCQTRKRRYNLQALFRPEWGSFSLYSLYFPQQPSCYFIELHKCPQARFVIFQWQILIYRHILYYTPARAKFVASEPVLKMLYEEKRQKKLYFDPHGLMSYSVKLKCNIWLHLRYSINLLVNFKGAANNSDYIAWNVLMPTGDEWEIAWKEAVLAWFMVLSRILCLFDRASSW